MSCGDLPNFVPLGISSEGGLMKMFGGEEKVE